MKKEEKWQLAILDYVFYDTDIIENVIAHISLIHNDLDESELDYYEVLIPELNFKSMFVTKEKIIKIL